MNHPLAAISGQESSALAAAEEGDIHGIAEAYLARFKPTGTSGRNEGRRGQETALRNLATLYLSEFEPDRLAAHAGSDGRASATPWKLVPWHGITAQAVDHLTNRLATRKVTDNKAGTVRLPSAAYVAKHYSALRGLAKVAYRMERISNETYSRILHCTDGGRKGVKKQEPAGRDLSRAELDRLLEACRNDPRVSARRDAAMIAFAWATGARREEMAALSMADLRHETTEHGPSLAGKLLGKGNKERDFHLYNGHRALVMEWLRLRGDAPGPVFCRTTKAGDILTGQRITTTSAHRNLIRRAKLAGLSEDLSWHDFRRTVAGDLLDGGTDIVTVAAVLGHSSVSTTARYDRRGKRARQAAMAKR